MVAVRANSKMIGASARSTGVGACVSVDGEGGVSVAVDMVISGISCGGGGKVCVNTSVGVAVGNAGVETSSNTAGKKDSSTGVGDGSGAGIV